jgi:signal transduction histidine kinase
VAVAAGLVNLAPLLLHRSALDAPPAYLVINLVGVCWSFVAAGVVALAHRPGNRTGWLMIAFGLAWSVHGLGVLRGPLPSTLLFLMATLPDAILGHLIAVFPEGRATTRLQRVFLVANYATTVPLAVALLLLFSPDLLRCPMCLSGVAAVASTSQPVMVGSGLVDVSLVVVLIWIVVTRWRQSPQVRRRSLAPVVRVGLVLLVVFLVQQGLAVAMPATRDRIYVGLQWALLLLLMLWPIAFLMGLARLRLDRSSVGDLALRLGGTIPPSGLEQAIASALHDRTLRLLYWLPDRQVYVDVAGVPTPLPADTDDQGVTLLEHEGEPVAALVHQSALGEEPDLLAAVASTARMTIENELLHAQVQSQLAQVRASRARIVQSGDAERRRVERNLHDGAQQRLVNLSLAIGMVRSQVGTATAEELTAALDEATSQLRFALAELRELARGIHPAILTEAGLGPALTSLATRSPIPATILAVPSQRLAGSIEETAYYVAAEALANTAKHARATRVQISARQLAGQLVVEVGDDGVGGADPDGWGLRGLGDRVAALDGDLRIDSPPGKGTRITARLPCES